MKERDAAHGVHQLVLMHGYERAREMVPERQRSLVDIAAEVLADERQNIGISYTGFCLTSLPHKRLPENQAWQKQGHRVTLLVEPGRLKTAKGEMRLYGVPYGARARMILLYLQTQRGVYRKRHRPLCQGCSVSCARAHRTLRLIR